MNGECRCRKGFSGTYCQSKDSDGASIGTMFFYLAMFLFVVVVILALFYGAYFVIKKIVSTIVYFYLFNVQEEQKRRLYEAERLREANPAPQGEDMNRIIDVKSGVPSLSSKYDTAGVARANR